ncbi:hypothetical protein N9D90_00805 [Alphaproteobacteria bacterium]|nr:hypothetical protein [Alphaproteobacteria bacterium]
MEYKDEMRKLIDIVKQQSFTAPLQSTLDDMKVLTTAVKDLNDRIEIRVRKSLVGDDDKAKKKLKTKAVKKAKPFPSISPPTQTQQTSTQSAIPTSNAVTSTATTQMDYNKAKDDFVAKQTALQPIKPIATQ